MIFTDCFNTHFKTIFPDARPYLWSRARDAQVQDELGDTLPEEQEEELGPAGAAGAIGQEEGAERGETGQEGADEAAAGVVRSQEALLSWTKGLSCCMGSSFHYWSHLIDCEVVSKVARHLSAPDFGALVGGRPAWWWGAGATLGLA